MANIFDCSKSLSRLLLSMLERQVVCYLTVQVLIAGFPLVMLLLDQIKPIEQLVPVS